MTVKLQYISEGIYIVTTRDQPCPNTYVHEGKQLFRFMNVFYLDRPSDELTESQVKALCQARLSLPDDEVLGGSNRLVKGVLRSFVHQLCASAILEVGSGTSPILSSDFQDKRYVLADFDRDCVDANLSSGFESVLFSTNGNLEFKDGTFDLIMAAFVFQFRVYDAQLIELKRCLAPNGVAVCNVYLRSERSRAGLAQQIQRYDLDLGIVSDFTQACRDNEYWVFGKSGEAVTQSSKLIERILKSQMQSG